MKAYGWFSRFDPCCILGDAEVGWWVTDRYRLHRICHRHRAWLERFDYVDGPLELTFDGGVPEAWEWKGYDLRRAMRWLDVSARLRLLVVPTWDQVQMLTGDMQTIHVNRRYYECAVRDGVRHWRGSAPGRPIFGLDDADVVQAIVKPLTTIPPPSPALRSLRRSAHP